MKTNDRKTLEAIRDASPDTVTSGRQITVRAVLDHENRLSSIEERFQGSGPFDLGAAAMAWAERRKGDRREGERRARDPVGPDDGDPGELEARENPPDALVMIRVPGNGGLAVTYDVPAAIAEAVAGVCRVVMHGAQNPSAYFDAGANLSAALAEHTI